MPTTSSNAWNYKSLKATACPYSHSNTQSGRKPPPSPIFSPPLPPSHKSSLPPWSLSPGLALSPFGVHQSFRRCCSVELKYAPPASPHQPTTHTQRNVKLLEQRLYLWKASSVWEEQEDFLFLSSSSILRRKASREDQSEAEGSHIPSPPSNKRQEPLDLNPSWTLVAQPSSQLFPQDLGIGKSGNRGGGECGDDPVVGKMGTLRRTTMSEGIPHLANPSPQRAGLGGIEDGMWRGKRRVNELVALGNLTSNVQRGFWQDSFTFPSLRSKHGPQAKQYLTTWAVFNKPASLREKSKATSALSSLGGRGRLLPAVISLVLPFGRWSWAPSGCRPRSSLGAPFLVLSLWHLVGHLAQGRTPGCQKTPEGWLGREQSKRRLIWAATSWSCRLELETARRLEGRRAVGRELSVVWPTSTCGYLRSKAARPSSAKVHDGICLGLWRSNLF